MGADTVVLGLKFSVSHPPKNRAADGGVAFVNGPALSAAAFNPLAGASVLPLEDAGGYRPGHGLPGIVRHGGGVREGVGSQGRGRSLGPPEAIEHSGQLLAGQRAAGIAAVGDGGEAVPSG